MSAGLTAISAAPFLLGTKRVGVAANPGFGFHETAAFGTTLAVFNKEWAILARVVTLVANLFRDLAIYNSLANIADKTPGHLAKTRVDFSGMNWPGVGSLRCRHELPVTASWPRRNGTRWGNPVTTQLLKDVHARRKRWASMPISTEPLAA